MKRFLFIFKDMFKIYYSARESVLQYFRNVEYSFSIMWSYSYFETWKIDQNPVSKKEKTM